MKRGLIAMVLAGLFCVPANAAKLTQRQARHETADVGRWDVHDGYATGYRILGCGRLGRKRVLCFLREYNVPSQYGNLSFYDDAIRIVRTRGTPMIDNVDFCGGRADTPC